MHTPAWLLKILISYLSNRSMHLSYNGAQSTQKPLYGVGPQGVYLGGKLFMLKYNGALLRPSIPKNIVGPISKSKSEKVKYVDDGSVAVSLYLKSCLELDQINRPNPLNFRERTKHVVHPDNNLIQAYIKDIEQYSIANKMVINKKKTQVMLFNKSRKLDFPPEIMFSDGSLLNVISEIKLLGVLISDDLSWHKNTIFICKKAREKLWILRRLINLGLSENHLFDVYSKQIRSLLEIAVPVWHPSITQKDSKQIERIQKVAFKIILGDRYLNYEHSCFFFDTTSLASRREKLCKSFAIKNLKSDNSFFSLVNKNVNTRSKSRIVEEFRCRTTRFEKSSLPYMAKLLNK